MRERRQHNPTGYVLVTTLLTVATFGTLIGSMLGRSVTELRAAERFVESQQAFYLAEAGVDQGWAMLRANPTLALPAICPATDLIGPGTGGCTITNQAGGTMLITGTGSVADAQRTIQAVVEFQTTSVFRWALFADETHVHFHGGGLIDSYDSSEGPYDPAAPKDPHGAPVATNDTDEGAIAIENGAELWGDATVGVGGDPDEAIDTDGGGVIHGERAAAVASVTLPPIVLPTGSPVGFSLASCPAVTTITVDTFPYSSVTLPPNCQVTLVGDGVIHLDDLELGANSTLQLEGNIKLATSKLTLRSNSKLRVDSGSAEIYVSGGPVDIYNGNLVNSTVDQDPSRFALYVQGDRRVWLNPSTVFHGAIYIPDGEVRLFGTAEVFGSLVTNHVNAANGSAPQFHYDRNLATLETSATVLDGGLVLRSWSQP